MRRFAVSLALLAVAATCPAAEPSPSDAAFQPTPVPARILLSWKGDPATTAAVSWRTDAGVTQPVAQIAVAGHGPEFEEEAETVRATTQPLDTNLGAARYHSASFERLKPDTVYAYRVG